MAEYAVVVTVSPLTIRPRGSSDAQSAKRLTTVTDLVVGATVAYDLLDPTETLGSDDTIRRSGTLVVLGRLA